MAWQTLNLKDAKLNMSKVIPYDNTLSLLDNKQAYYHNNRLTALRKYTTNKVVGYKCFKRQKNSNHLVDNQLTDYIEINKVLTNGNIEHMLDIADKYYKAENVSAKSDIDEMLEDTHLIINGIDLGLSSQYYGYTFVSILNKVLLVQTPNNTVELWSYSSQYQTKTEILNVTSLTDLYLIKDTQTEGTEVLYVIPQAQWTEIRDFQTTYIFNYKITEKKIFYKNYNILMIKNGFFSYKVFRQFHDNTNFDYTRAFHVDDCFLSPIGLIYTNAIYDFNTNGCYLTEFKIKSFNSEDISLSNLSFVNIKGVFMNISPIVMFDKTEISDFYKSSIIQNSNDFKIIDIGNEVIYSKTISKITYETIASIFIFHDNRNETKSLSNGFVLNFLNKVPVSIGHNYKLIARLDTQGASYQGYDANYIYVKQKGNYYRISIATMFPDVEYDEEVNIINSEFCNKISGYKIFNTTTYYNAIYDDNSDKVICSCDDWNSRISFQTEKGDSHLIASSRVGHFWNADAENIPCKAISDEQIDFPIFENEFVASWSNSSYKIHPGTKAYLYFGDSVEADTKIQQYEITSNGINLARATDKVFVHNANYQLVPSILFCSFLKSDILNVIQIGSEAYELQTYSYSPITIALIYEEIPITINVDSNSYEMVIQGAYYSIGGASAARKIFNPYDTSTSTYCCDVTGLKYLGYDSEQGYFYSPATGVIYTFNGANKLNSFLEVDNRIPLISGKINDTYIGIQITNIPSMNIIAMPFTDGVLIITNGQSIFIEQQNITDMSADKELGSIIINGAYYYFGTNSVIQNIIDNAKDVSIDFKIKTAKIGINNVFNQICLKHRLSIYSDILKNNEKAEIEIKIKGLLGNKTFEEDWTKTFTTKDLINNQFEWEFTPRNTKYNYFTIELKMKNADLLNYYLDINEVSENNQARL